MRTASRLALGASLLAPVALPAQHADHARVSVHALLGALLPAGRHRSVVGDAFAIGAQVALGLRPSLALVGGALISQPVYRSGARSDVTVAQYDLGLEVAPRSDSPTHRRAVPFGGAGAGVRSYDGVGRPGGRRFFPAGYASAGAELTIGRVGLRLEARDYVSRSETRGTMSGNRNDVTAVTGLAYHFR